MAVKTDTADTAGTSGTTSTGTITGTSTVSAAMADRSQHRAASRDLRDNAGIDLRERVEAVADFGAAARRLRDSVRGGEDAPRQRCFNPASVRAAAAAAAAPLDGIGTGIEIGDVVVAEVESVVEGKKRESVTLKYLRNRKAAEA